MATSWPWSPAGRGTRNSLPSPALRPRGSAGINHWDVPEAKAAHPGGGGHSGTGWLPSAKRPRRGKALNAKKRGWSATPLKAKRGLVNCNRKNLIRVVTCKMCLFSHFCEMLYGRIGVPFVCDFTLRNYDFRGQWPATPKNRGRSKKRGGSLAVGSHLQRGNAFPPPGAAHQLLPVTRSGRTNSPYPCPVDVIINALSGSELLADALRWPGEVYSGAVE